MAKKAIVTATLLINDESSSSDEEEFDSEFPLIVGGPLILALQRKNKHKVDGYAEEVIPLYMLNNFQRFFRMTRATFEVICEQLGTFDTFRTTSSGRKAVPIDKQLLVFLWHVGGLEPLCRTADRFNITEFTVLRIRTKMCKVVQEHLIKKYITWPKDQEKDAIIQAFRDKRGFPDVMGALDRTHIQIRPPKEHPQTYVNRKGYHSIILQAVCREDIHFKNCFVGWPGSCHDSRVLKNSDLWDNGQHWCGEKHLIGDGGFPLTMWLLTPYRDAGHLMPLQRHYNFCLSSTRQVIERAFALLKGRFRKVQILMSRVLLQQWKFVSHAAHFIIFVFYRMTNLGGFSMKLIMLIRLLLQ